jgi:hypothetical protein
VLVTFSCTAHENITMFGDVATNLLKLMGHSGTIPSALLAKDVPEALQNLKNAVESISNGLTPHKVEEEEPSVSLKLRAYPLIKLLEDAAREECNVMWR